MDAEKYWKELSLRGPSLPMAIGPKLDQLGPAAPCVTVKNAVTGRGSAKANSADSSQRGLQRSQKMTPFQGSVQVGSHGLNFCYSSNIMFLIGKA